MAEFYLEVPFDSIEGKTLTKVEEYSESIDFYFDDGTHYTMEHHQDCCEICDLQDIDGDLSRLIGQTIILAEDREGDSPVPEEYSEGYDVDSNTWVFYVIRTNLDSVTISWFGASNCGYYRETAGLYKEVDEETNRIFHEWDVKLLRKYDYRSRLNWEKEMYEDD